MPDDITKRNIGNHKKRANQSLKSTHVNQRASLSRISVNLPDEAFSPWVATTNNSSKETNSNKQKKVIISNNSSKMSIKNSSIWRPEENFSTNIEKSSLKSKSSVPNENIQPKRGKECFLTNL